MSKLLEVWYDWFELHVLGGGHWRMALECHKSAHQIFVLFSYIYRGEGGFSTYFYHPGVLFFKDEKGQSHE